MDTTEKKQNFVNRQISAVTELLKAIEALKALRAEWDALDYGTVIEDEDLGETQAHLTAAMLASAFSSFAVLNDELAGGHYTNLYQVTR